MSKEYGIRVRCDGCGEESEWATPDPFGGTLGQGLDDLRATLARRKWGRDDDEGDLCPLCVRADLQRDRLVPDEKGGEIVSEPRFGAWTAVDVALPELTKENRHRQDVLITSYLGEVFEAQYMANPGARERDRRPKWWRSGRLMDKPPVRWMPMPKPGETAGPGEATRALLKGLAEHLEDHGGEVNTMEVWVEVDELEAALRECGIEVEP